MALFGSRCETPSEHKTNMSPRWSVQRSTLGRTIAKLKKSRKAGDTAATPEERLAQEKQLNDLIVEAARVDQEIAALREHTRLLKVKLFLIKL